MTDDRTDLDRATSALHAQWTTLRAWLADLVADDGVDLAAPSVLPGWTVAELIAHLGRAMDALAAVRPAPPGTTPLSLGTYLGGYTQGAADIAETTRTLAAAIAPDPLGGVDAMVRGALDNLERLTPDDGVVLARRGPMTLAHMVLTRVIELVVHADDLARSVERPGAAPLDPGALDLAAGALLGVLRDRGGPDVEVGDPLAWVRLAAGRAPADGGEVAAALRTPSSADAAAALAAVLPLF
jgi:uncharacterized protein (TIGR03083 family)